MLKYRNGARWTASLAASSPQFTSAPARTCNTLQQDMQPPACPVGVHASRAGRRGTCMQADLIPTAEVSCCSKPHPTAIAGGAARERGHAAAGPGGRRRCGPADGAAHRPSQHHRRPSPPCCLCPAPPFHTMPLRAAHMEDPRGVAAACCPVCTRRMTRPTEFHSTCRPWNLVATTARPTPPREPLQSPAGQEHARADVNALLLQGSATCPAWLQHALIPVHDPRQLSWRSPPPANTDRPL